MFLQLSDTDQSHGSEGEWEYNQLLNDQEISQYLKYSIYLQATMGKSDICNRLLLQSKFKSQMANQTNAHSSYDLLLKYLPVNYVLHERSPTKWLIKPTYTHQMTFYTVVH